MSIWNKKYVDMTLGDAMKVTGIVTIISLGISGAIALVGYGIDEGWFEKKKRTVKLSELGEDYEPIMEEEG